MYVIALWSEAKTKQSSNIKDKCILINIWDCLLQKTSKLTD